MIRHPEHLHCMHIHGWVVQRWCPRCRLHWEETCGKVHCRSYEQQADMEAAHAICLLMESGDVPIPCEFANLELAERVPWPPAPSEN
jgi:hypothetical protein